MLSNHSLFNFINSSMFSPSLGVRRARLSPHRSHFNHGHSSANKFFYQLFKVQTIIVFTYCTPYHPWQGQYLCIKSWSLPIPSCMPSNSIRKRFFLTLLHPYLLPFLRHVFVDICLLLLVYKPLHVRITRHLSLPPGKLLLMTTVFWDVHEEFCIPYV